MALFTKSQLDKVNAIAAKSTQAIASTKAVDSKSIVDELNAISEEVLKYFHDSEAQEITTVEELHDYITKCLATKDKIVGYDTETTGLDRIHDTIVGFSLYYPGGVEVYIPINHKVPIFDTRYPNQLTYEDVRPELQRLVDGSAKLIMANADFDIAMTFKDIKVDLKDVTYYDVILAWRCLREDEKDNSLKGLYAKYPMQGKILGKKFSDFFSPQLFPYAKPAIAKLYAANDAKITVELFFWQLPYVTKSNPKCQKNHLEKIADLIWNIEIPMIPVCAELHRNGIYLEQSIAEPLQIRWANKLEFEQAKLAKMVDEILEAKDTPYNSKRPFTSGRDFNARSSKPVMYLLANLLGLDIKKANKETLADYSNIPVVAQILKIRSLGTIISTFVDKLPKAVAPDGRIHGEFKSIGAATGRMCIAKGEMVQLANGTEIPIEKVEVGMYVNAFSGAVDGSPIEPHRVINKWKTGQDRECVKVCTDTTSVICTPEHKFYVARKGWIEAKDLTPTDRLIVTAKLPIGDTISYITEHQKVKSVDKLDEHFDVYDIEVENVHHFIVNGICVHNSSQNPNMQNIPSHATDIRHLFRATPEITQNMWCEPSDGIVTLKLFQADSLPTNDDKYIMVKDIKIGDQVRFEQDHKEYFLEVKSKSDLDKFGNVILEFNANSLTQPERRE